jgi:tetratricopeptide (TPR) repeat protein
MLETVIDICDKRLDKNPDDVTALFFKGGSLGFRGRLRANRGNWVGAARDGVAALPIVRRAHELAPENTDVLLGIGIYNYYAEVVPDRYPLVKPLMIFFPSGDRALGLQQLERAAREARYASSEARYFLAQSYYQFERDYGRSLESSRILHDRYPRNPLFHRGVGRALVGLGRWEEAFVLFFEIQRRCQERWTGYDDPAAREAYYYIGQSYFNNGRYDDARTALELCEGLSKKLDTAEESGFWVMAVLTLGKISDAQGKRAEAQQFYERVLDMQDYHSAHRQAEVFLSYPYRGH